MSGLVTWPVAAEDRMQAFVEAMQPGWNLGNTFDAKGAETSWGNPETTEEIIRAIRAEGYNSIRIPITWNHRMGAAPNYEIQPAFLERIQQVVDWSLDAGFVVMINMHHDSDWMFNMPNEREAVADKFRAAWRQIAAHFKDYPHELVFEGLNEPRFSHDWNEDQPLFFELVHELQTIFHEEVRGSGGNNATRPIVLTTVTGGHGQARLNALVDTIEQLDDPNVIATVHFYGYYPFSVNMAGATTFDETAKQDIIHNFDRIHNTFVVRGIPVIIGEFGLLGFDHHLDTIQHGEVLKYLEFLTYYAKEKRMTHMLWDNGQHFDRRALQWTNPAFHRIMMASLEGRSSTAETDTLYFRAGEPVVDTVLPLHLHGNALTDVLAGERTLVAGDDYVLDGEQLTLKAGLLQELVSGEPGDSAELVLQFSAGADWTLHLVSYDTPVLNNADWSKQNFAIPAAFNGDRLKTMEARYPSGVFAGPESWTPYKQFGASFDADYARNMIRLTADFFREVEDGEVKLTFHFWSGEKLDYHLLVKGNKVTGTVPGSEADSSADGDEAGSDSEGGAEAEDAEPALGPVEIKEGLSQEGDGPDGNLWLWAVVLVALAVLVGIMFYRFVRR